MSVPLRLKLECTTSWLQFECKDAWTPEFTIKSVWSVNIKSIQEELFVCICVGSFDQTNLCLFEYNFDHSVVLTSLDPQEEDAAWDGLRLFMSLKMCWKFGINESKSSLFWLREQ